MRPLLPTLKERKRYILVKVLSKTEIEKRDVLRLVTKANVQFLGELGMARAKIRPLMDTWDLIKKTFIIKVGHKHTDELIASLGMIKNFEGKKVSLTTLKTSGSVDKLKSK